MYGMIHRGIRQMMIDELGEDAWREVQHAAGTGPAELISAEVYPDATTLALVASAAQRLGLDTASFLRAFGRYWVRFAERGSFGAIMAFVGSDLPGFITNLDRMHRSVRVAMPEAILPAFELLEHDATGLRLAYRSRRDGLEPFVIGLLEGLVARFGQAGQVALEGHDGGAALFRITLEPQPA